jgi:hypothetical protein
MSPQNWGLGGERRTLRLDLMTCVHTVALGERNFESCSLLPQGEGLGMRAVQIEYVIVFT